MTYFHFKMIRMKPSYCTHYFTKVFNYAVKRIFLKHSTYLHYFLFSLTLVSDNMNHVCQTNVNVLFDKDS